MPVIPEPEPLVDVQGVNVDRNTYLYATLCRDCGDVTQAESNFTIGSDVPGVGLEQAYLYARRHLGRHLSVLTEEIVKYNR